MPRPLHLHLYIPPEREPIGKLLADLKGAAPGGPTDYDDLYFGGEGAPESASAQGVAPTGEPVTFMHEFVPFPADPKLAGDSPLLARVERALAGLRKRGLKDADLRAAFARILHSPALALLVAITPTPADNAALEMLKALFPAA